MKKARDGGNTDKEVILVKSLLIITTLVSSISVSSVALTSDHMSLYSGTTTRSGISTEVHGSYVQKDLTDFYIEPAVPVEKEERQDPVLIAETLETDSESSSEYINVFGVMVPTEI